MASILVIPLIKEGFVFIWFLSKRKAIDFLLIALTMALSSTDLSHNRRSELRWKEGSQEVDGDYFIRNVEQTELEIFLKMDKKKISCWIIFLSKYFKI